MNFSRDELKKLALPVAACLVLGAAGLWLLAAAGSSVQRAKGELVVAQQKRAENTQRLARIAEEEREVKEKLAVYEHLKRLNILGEERRLEWADAMSRIRSRRELPDLRYRVERQREVASLPGKPGTVDFFASAMKVDLALLHEGDLLRFLDDLRNSGNAYYAVRACRLSRTTQRSSGAAVAPRLQAECEIDLITIQDRGAKS